MKKDLMIRNSTAEFLIFQSQAKEDSIEVKFVNGTVWLSQRMIAKLFDIDRSVITKHLKNTFDSNELNEISVSAKFAHTASDGKIYDTKFYNLDAIISVGYRVNSKRATEFRIWATNVLKQFAIKGYVLDKERLKNGTFLNKEFFQNLLEEIREIRVSERNFYQKITDIYATSMDYNKNSKITKDFFKKVQNKMHYAVHKHTAPELIMNRADSKKKFMGLTSWENSPKGKISKSDVIVAKNYLNQKEIKALNRIITMYLDYAEDQAENKIPMTMNDWAKKLDVFLQFNNKELLENAGKITQKIAKEFAESEFEIYRITQDRLFESDFDKLLKQMNKNIVGHQNER